MTFLHPTTDDRAVAVSLVIAALAAALMLDVVRRMRTGDRTIAFAWWLGGALTAGTGLAAAAFLRADGCALSMPVGASIGLLVLTWFCAVAAAGAALRLAGGTPPKAAVSLAGTLVVGGLLCAAGRCAFASLNVDADIAWHPLAALAAFATSVATSACLLGGAHVLRTPRGWRSALIQAAIAIVFALGADAVALFGLSAADVQSSLPGLLPFDRAGGMLHEMIVVTIPLLLACMLVSSVMFGFADQRRTALAGSLQHVAARLDSANDELRKRAMHDPLTGLPNRILFEDRLTQALLRADRAKRSVRGLREKLAVLFVDIDGFKAVNDSFGHAVGDDVIRRVGVRLREAARNHDTVSRIGADQFVVLMETATSSNDCVALATRILDLTKVPLEIADRLVPISLSVGLVIFPDHGDRSKLLGQAEAAMHAAKRAGRGTYALFESHMHHDMADQLDLINDLRQAIDLGQLELHYQPKVDARRHVICGVEALLRWHHPTRGLVSPGVFVPLAERFGLINALGNWVVEDACRQMEAWSKDRIHMRVAINLSVHQLREPDLVARISSALDRHSVKASHLLCEITESVAMQDVAATQRTLDDLGRIGVYLSIDDFGTGYSSLSYLRQLPARQLKIDRSFVADLDTSDDAKAVVDGVVRLAHALGLRVVAEGVETATQRDILLELNCDELQGFFFARPMTAEKLVAWTLGHKPKGTVDFAESLVHRPVEA